MNSTIDLDNALSLALETAKIAAEVALDYHKKIRPSTAGKKLSIATKASSIDFVTEADKEVQKVIIRHIQDKHPDHRFIAEEKGADDLGDPSSTYAWIVDPIDGTIPFIHGKEDFGIIIALEENGKVVLGIIYIPLRDELFRGTYGKGAFFNDAPIELRATANMQDAILCSNVVRMAKEIDGMLYSPTPLCSSLENYGSASREFGEILRGHNDGVFFNGVRYWDIAAGCLMLEEAGGKARYEFQEQGNLRSGLYVAASTRPIFEELEEFVFKKLKMKNEK